MADVFISYSSEDRERVRPLAEALESRGFSVWWDRALAAGDDYSTVIRKALDEAKATIVVWSNQSVESPWVRDEAGRAREARRLVPIMIDKVDIPLGFGSINAEDFTSWNGRGNAAQMELLAEALKARIEGRSPDGAALQAKRRRLMSRIRIVSLLTATAAGVGIIGGVLNIMDRNKPDPTPIVAPPADSLSRLLELVKEGKITGDQAVELAKLLEDKAFTDIPEVKEAEAQPPLPGPGTELAAGETTSPATGAAAPGEPAAMRAEVASVSQTELTGSAKATFSESAAQLLQDPDPRVRVAALKASSPATRKDGMDELWKIANEGGASQAAIYRFCAAVGVVTDDPRAQQALEKARDLNPQDRKVWRMLSFNLDKQNKTEAAQGAALVGDGLAKAAAGQEEKASESLEKALPLLKDSDGRAFVLGQLGDAAAKRDDWSAAEQRYKQAVDLHAVTKDTAGLAVDASKLARAQAAQGETKSACTTLKRAQRLGAEAVQQQLDQTCEAPEAPAIQQRELKLRATTVAPKTTTTP